MRACQNANCILPVLSRGGRIREELSRINVKTKIRLSLENQNQTIRYIKYPSTAKIKKFIKEKEYLIFSEHFYLEFVTVALIANQNIPHQWRVMMSFSQRFLCNQIKLLSFWTYFLNKCKAYFQYIIEMNETDKFYNSYSPKLKKTANSQKKRN